MACDRIAKRLVRLARSLVAQKLELTYWKSGLASFEAVVKSWVGSRLLTLKELDAGLDHLFQTALLLHPPKDNHNGACRWPVAQDLFEKTITFRHLVRRSFPHVRVDQALHSDRS